MAIICLSKPRFVGALSIPPQSAEIYRWVSSPLACLGLCRRSYTGRTWRAEYQLLEMDLQLLSKGTNGLWAATSMCYTYTKLTPKWSLQRLPHILRRTFSSFWALYSPSLSSSSKGTGEIPCIVATESPLALHQSKSSSPSCCEYWCCLITVPQPQEGSMRDCGVLTLFAGVTQDLVDLSICRVLPQCPDDIANLA